VSDIDATRKRHRVADPLREYIAKTWDGSMYVNQVPMALMEIADQIDSEHERRMEQCRHETKRAFGKYLRQITGEYERGHKRKSWTAQQRMQLELDVLKYEEAKHEDD